MIMATVISLRHSLHLGAVWVLNLNPGVSNGLAVSHQGSTQGCSSLGLIGFKGLGVLGLGVQGLEFAGFKGLGVWGLGVQGLEFTGFKGLGVWGLGVQCL